VFIIWGTNIGLGKMTDTRERAAGGFEGLSSEMILAIVKDCDGVAEVVSLWQCCRKLRREVPFCFGSWIVRHTSGERACFGLRELFFIWKHVEGIFYEPVWR
jgi:hypothetical protein